MNERKILLIGCSWTAGTDYDEVTDCYRPAPAEYLDTNLYKIYNAGVAGSPIHLHNFLLEGLLTSIKPDHVFFQITHPKYDKYLVDEGYHLNPKGAELYCKKIYESNLN